MKLTRKLLLIALAISILGFMLKMLLIPGGGLCLVVGLFSSSLLALIQSIMSFAKIKENSILRILSILMNLTLSLGFLGILFRYQWYSGWYFIYALITPLFVILTITFFAQQNKFNKSPYEKYISRNILIPWIFVFVFGLIPILVPPKTFYNIFSYKRETMNYEEFVDKITATSTNVTNTK